jgi:hypothetical protein
MCSMVMVVIWAATMRMCLAQAEAGNGVVASGSSSRGGNLGCDYLILRATQPGTLDMYTVRIKIMRYG